RTTVRHHENVTAAEPPERALQPLLPRLAGLGGRMPEVVDRDADARQIRTLLHDRRQILPGHHAPHEPGTPGATPPPLTVALQLDETLGAPARHMLVRARRGDLACRVHTDHRLFRSTPLSQFGARSSPQRRRSTRSAGSRSGCTPPASRADTDAVMRWRVAPRSPAYAAAAAAASGEVWSIPTSEIASMTAPAASRSSTAKRSEPSGSVTPAATTAITKRPPSSAWRSSDQRASTSALRSEPATVSTPSSGTGSAPSSSTQ